MDLKQYFTPLIRWWWLLVLAALVAGGTSFYFVRKQPPVYQAYSTLMIGRLIQDPNPNSNQFLLVQQLASTYADIANREPVRNKTMEALGLSFLPSTYVRDVSGGLIAISVNDTDPKRAQAVANELANQLILASPTGSNSDQSRQEFINEQLDQIQSQIKDTNAEIVKLQQQLGDLNSARQIADTQTQITAQQEKLSGLQSNYASLLATSQNGAINTLSVIEPAGLPTTPMASNKKMTVALAVGISLVIASIAAYGMEALDDTVKSAEDIDRLAQLPVIGYIGNVAKNDWKHVNANPRSQTSEAFRSLRTSLEFLSVDKPQKTILVTSSNSGEGKTFIAINLALSLSQTEKKVILVDCDLRNPHVHRALEIKSEQGLTKLFLEHIPVLDSIQILEGSNLAVIPVGNIPPNPAELLGSSRMEQILDALSEMYDVIILDSAPMMTADTQVLSAKVDGVVLISRYARTRKNRIRIMVEQLKRANARIVGVVINSIPHMNTLPYSYYASRYDMQGIENQYVKSENSNGNHKNSKFIPWPKLNIKNPFHRKEKIEELGINNEEDILFARFVSHQKTDNIEHSSSTKETNAKEDSSQFQSQRINKNIRRKT